MWKTFIGIVLLFSIGFPLWFNNVSEGLEQAQKSNKPVAFYF